MPKLTSELFALKRALVFITHEARLVGPQPVSVSLRVPSQSIFSGPSTPLSFVLLPDGSHPFPRFFHRASSQMKMLRVLKSRRMNCLKHKVTYGFMAHAVSAESSESHRRTGQGLETYVFRVCDPFGSFSRRG